MQFTLCFVYIPLLPKLSYDSKKNTRLKLLLINDFLIQFYIFRQTSGDIIHSINDGKFTFIVPLMWKFLRVVIFWCTFSSACTEKKKNEKMKLLLKNNFIGFFSSQSEL